MYAGGRGELLEVAPNSGGIVIWPQLVAQCARLDGRAESNIKRYIGETMVLRQVGEGLAV
jgi:hypothetical protein